MGVSLSNKVFTSSFCKKLSQLALSGKPKSITIFLGDEIEIINYRIFSNKSMEDAQHTATTRGLSLARMFVKNISTLENAGILVNIFLESELRQSVRYGPLIKEMERNLNKLFRMDAQFRADVYEQVRTNLQHSKRSKGARFIEENIQDLSDYIIGELAIFLSLFKGRRAVLEVYPGEALFVKNNILNGKYRKLPWVNCEILYEFRDISELKDFCS